MWRVLLHLAADPYPDVSDLAMRVLNSIAYKVCGEAPQSCAAAAQPGASARGSRAPGRAHLPWPLRAVGFVCSLPQAFAHPDSHFFFFLKNFIYLKGGVVEREGQRSDLWFTPGWLPLPGLVLCKAKSPAALHQPHVAHRACSLPSQEHNGELGHKWAGGTPTAASQLAAEPWGRSPCLCCRDMSLIHYLNLKPHFYSLELKTFISA